MSRTPVRSVLLALAVAAVALALASCGDDDTSATTTTRRATTAKPTTSTTSTTSTVPPSPAGGPTTSIPEDVPGDALPDGDQVGYLTAIDLRTNTVTVDLAELLTGPDAAAAHQADTGTPLDGEQVYVRNRDPKLRTVPIDPSGSYAVIYSASCCGPTSVSLEGLAEAVGGDWQGVIQPHPPFNISVQGGRVTAAVQIYRP